MIDGRRMNLRSSDFSRGMSNNSPRRYAKALQKFYQTNLNSCGQGLTVFWLVDIFGVVDLIFEKEI